MRNGGQRDGAEQVLLQSFGVSEAELQKFSVYYDMLVAWNERMNLTAITEEREVYIKHFADSLMVRNLPEWQDAVLREGGRVADIGTGAGFPGLPLAICHPEVSFVLADSLAKRLKFLEAVVERLGLCNVRLVHGRAEDLGRLPEFRGQFRAVLARAVARLNILLELTAPFCSPGGYVFAYKGPGIADELADGQRAARVLGCEVVRVERRELADAMGDRCLVVVRQVRPVPGKYPRRAGTPQKTPL